MQKKILIHAGPGKTGSSAIQHWCLQNIEVLQAQGIFYPVHSIDDNNVSSGHKYLIFSGDAKNIEVSDKKIDELLAIFHSSSYRLLLLSSEFFFAHIETLAVKIPSAEFVLYVRNPVEIIESGYNQSVKRHNNANRNGAGPKARLPYLDRFNQICKTVENHRLYFRPYNRNLFQGGDIVSDILSVIGAEANTESQQINLSYTYQALEFKRTCNSFPLGKLSHRLDRLLQSYSEGDRKFSVLAQPLYQSLTQRAVEELEQFIEKHNIDSLKGLPEAFQQAKQKPIKKELMEEDEFTSVLDYIKEKDVDLFEAMGSIVKQYACLDIDYPILYQCFGMQFSQYPYSSSELEKTIRSFSVNPAKHPKIVLELASYYENKREFGEALRYWSAGRVLNPNNDMIRSRYNQCCIELVVLNKANRVQKKGWSVLKEFATRLKRYVRLKLVSSNVLLR